MPVASQLMKHLLNLEQQMRVRMRMKPAWFPFEEVPDKDKNYLPALFVIMRSVGSVVKNHDLPDLCVAVFRTFQLLKRKTESQNSDTQSLLYLLSLAQSNADSRVSHANEIVEYYKKEHSKKRRQFEQKVCCVCLWRYSSLSNYSKFYNFHHRGKILLPNLRTTNISFGWIIHITHISNTTYNLARFIFFNGKKNILLVHK